MTILVTAASKHGTTVEIAEAIANELNARGVSAQFLPLAAVTDIDPYEAVVLGSAIYTGRWLHPATAFVETHAEALRHRLVWLFSSGPVGDPPKPEGVPVDVAELIATTGACGHQVFAGRLDRQGLGFAEKAMTKIVRAVEGDFRDWDAVAAWADEIATAFKVAGQLT